MRKVFIVTSGEYSAYCINRVFSTEEKAKEFIKITMDLSRHQCRNKHTAQGNRTKTGFLA